MTETRRGRRPLPEADRLVKRSYMISREDIAMLEQIMHEHQCTEGEALRRVLKEAR